ncbi:MAG: arylsulfatase [Verrucomicrobiales bacterium]|nr:arylsulfatase [Verrucomicrobiales bacterium]
MKKWFLLLLGLTTSVWAAEKPNVLWIVADDLGIELGCYGDKEVDTPNIDRLAERGTMYTKAFASAPVCSASRTAFITGMYQTSVGGFHHRTRLIKPLPDPVKPVTEFFRDAGYWVSISKDDGKAGKYGKTDYNFEYETEEMFDGPDYGDRAEGQPFFHQVQIFEPHRTFKKSEEKGENLTIPPFYPDHPVIRADWANYLHTIEILDEKVGVVLDRLEEEGLADNTIIVFFGDHGRPHLRGKQWLYDAGIQVPLIVANPLSETAGQKDDRLVNLIDVAPTSLSLAGLSVPGYMQGKAIYTIDGPVHPDGIFAARDRCGDAPDRIRCVRTEDFKYIRNFHPELSYSQHSGYKKLQYPALTLMAVMNEQGRLKGRQAEWFADSRPAEELYDLKADPNELNNLADDPKYAETKADLSARLDEWIKETGDQGAEPEGDEDYMKALMDEKWEAFARGMKRRGLDAENLSERAYLNWWKKELGVE